MISRSGFTLVELAIVLVVIGLVVGGTVVGFDLIRAGGVRAVINEHNMYTNAVQAFRTKYSALPGDMKNATSFWGDNATACADAAITDGSPGTCNGDGDGTIEAASAANTTGEMFQFWVQLSKAGLSGGRLTGIAGSTNAVHCVLATNCPASKRDGAVWSVYYVGGKYAGSANVYSLEYGNYFFLGGQATTGLPITALFKPEEAYSIDLKIDDGKPGTGEVIAYYRTTCADSTAVDDYDSAYRVTDNTARCALYFVRQF